MSSFVLLWATEIMLNHSCTAKQKRLIHVPPLNQTHNHFITCFEWQICECSPCKFLQEVHFQGKQRTFNKNLFSQMPKIFLAAITYMQAIVPLKNDSYLFLQAGSVRPLFGPILRLFVPVYYMALKGKGWISLKIVQTFPPIQLGHLSNYFDLMRFYCSLERLTS